MRPLRDTCNHNFIITLFILCFKVNRNNSVFHKQFGNQYDTICLENFYPFVSWNKKYFLIRYLRKRGGKRYKVFNPLNDILDLTP